MSKITHFDLFWITDAKYFKVGDIIECRGEKRKVTQIISTPATAGIYSRELYFWEWVYYQVKWFIRRIINRIINCIINRFPERWP
jgi:hypothetical protein